MTEPTDAERVSHAPKPKRRGLGSDPLADIDPESELGKHLAREAERHRRMGEVIEARIKANKKRKRRK